VIALLVVNGREGEAKDIARAAKSEWDAPAFHAAVEKAVEVAGSSPARSTKNQQLSGTDSVATP